MTRPNRRSRVMRLAVALPLFVCMAIVAVPASMVWAQDSAEYTASEIQDWLISQLESSEVTLDSGPTVDLNSTDHLMTVDVSFAARGITAELDHPVEFTFDGSTGVSVAGRLSIFGKKPLFECNAEVECAAADGVPQVTSISNVKIADFSPSLSAGDLDKLAETLNKAIDASGLKVTSPGGDLTGINVVDDSGTPKLQLSWSGGGPLKYDAAAIQSKLTDAANSLIHQANDYLSTGYGDPDGRWWLRVTIASGELTFAAQFKLLGITAKIEDMDIGFTDLTASFTDATVSVGTSTKQTTFSGTADISCTNYVPSLTVTSLSVGDDYPGFRDYIADSGVNSALRDALDDLVDSLVTDTGLKCRLATFDHIEITGANTLRIWLEEREIQIPLKAGWNMVSVPVVPADTSVSSVFPGTEVVYTWNPATRSYYMPTDIEPEKGYWVAVIADTIITVSGSRVGSWTTDITAGWNMVGSIYDKDVDFTAPDDNPDGSVEAFAYWWDPLIKSYYFTQTLETKKGHWVAATQNCELTLS